MWTTLTAFYPFWRWCELLEMQRFIFALSLSLSTEKMLIFLGKKKKKTSNDVVFKDVSIWGAFEMVPVLKAH